MRLASMLLAVLPLAACMSDAPDESSSGDQPLVGVDGSRDQADRSCNVVLRSLGRNDMNGLGNYETRGTSWVFTGAVEISSAAAAEGLVPSVMWKTGTSTTWQVATGTAATDGSATPGYAKFIVRLDHDLPGPSGAVPKPVEVVPYLALTGGGRLFDHNRNPGDTDNYVMASPDFAVWGASGTCQAPTSGERGTLTFAADGTQHVDGVLAPGGQLVVQYDATRLAQCHETQGGHQLWDVTAHVQFDSGELLGASVRDGAATFAIPTDGARHVSLWFEATNASGCHAWDSSYGNNYVFDIIAPPQWIGLASNTLSRDTTYRCGASPASSPMGFGTWERQRAAITNLCFEVYDPGKTDRDNADLWKQLDTRVHWRVIGANGAASAWTTSDAQFDSRDGNNAVFALSWRNVDPFREYHCPEVAPIAEQGNPYVTMKLEYWIDVNGGQLRPSESGSVFTGTFADYPAEPWRTANCH